MPHHPPVRELATFCQLSVPPDGLLAALAWINLAISVVLSQGGQTLPITMAKRAVLLTATIATAQQQRIAIYVLSTSKGKRINGTHTEPLHWLHHRALPALDTWAKGFDRVVFVVEKSFEGSAAGQACNPARDGTLVCPRLNNAHVLTAECTDEYRGAGPCCKCDAAFVHAADAARPWDWVAFADDDVYFDPISTRHALSSAGDVDAPVAVVPQGSRRRPPFQASAKCRSAMPANYWAQPAILSRGALARAKTAFRSGGTQSECKLFSVSHEGGLGVLLWSLGVESLGLPEPDAYLRDSRYLRGLPAQPGRVRVMRRPKHKPFAVHRVGRGSEYPTAHDIQTALASPAYAGIPATAAVLRGAISPRDVSPGAPFVPFGPGDCNVVSP